MAAKAEQLDRGYKLFLSHNHGGTARHCKRVRRRLMRRLNRTTIVTEDYPTVLPFNRYPGWVS